MINLIFCQFAELLEPQNLKITPGNFSLLVEWEPPKSGILCLKHYHVTIEPNKYNFHENTTETNIQIWQLQACATYQVYINAVNKNDVDGKTAMESGTTNKSSKNFFS